jgi:predicted nucleic acid-binding Zn ribbon protein
LESSEVQSFYKASLNKDTTEKEMDAKRALLILETRRKTQRATMFTLLLVLKLFFLHTWLVHLVWIKEFFSGYNRN